METKVADPKTLMPNPFNTNRVGSDNMRKLKQSITDLGFASTVVCRTLADGSVQILGGHHRVIAAIELGIREVPILNLGTVDDVRAKKISLVDNSRYGTDDVISLAQLYEDLGIDSEQLAAFLPFSETDFDTVKKAIDINLDDLDIDLDDDQPDVDFEAPDRPQRTHDVLKFRVSLGDAENIRKLIEKTIKREGLDGDGTDDLTAAGSALAFLLLNTDTTE